MYKRKGMGRMYVGVDMEARKKPPNPLQIDIAVTGPTTRKKPMAQCWRMGLGCIRQRSTA